MDDRKYIYVSLKKFDYVTDRLKAVNGRQKAEINNLRRQIRDIQDFLMESPHASAYQLWKEGKKKD